jgi:hypothetical protein
MDMQNVSNLVIPEGEVRTIHDKGNRLLWGRLTYDTNYAGDTTQNGTPTPDAPVAVNVVTGEQTVIVSGKNLFDKNNYSILSGYFSGSGTITTPGYARNRIIYIPCKPNTTYSVTFPTTAEASLNTKAVATTSVLPASGVAIVGRVSTTGTSNTINNFITDSSAQYLCLYLQAPNGADISTYLDTIVSKIQIEEGSATSYEPYQGQSYPISLGATELCKIGTYQDYIYKSGDDWYVHKDIGKSILGSLSWVSSGTATSGVYRMVSTDLENIIFKPSSSSEIFKGFCTHYIQKNSTNTYYANAGISVGTNGYIQIYDASYNTSYSASSFKTWLTNNSVSAYYLLAAPTDIQITDATLISQLNAVHQWLTRYGYNATVSGNLPLIVDRTNL